MGADFSTAAEQLQDVHGHSSADVFAFASIRPYSGQARSSAPRRAPTLHSLERLATVHLYALVLAQLHLPTPPSTFSLSLSSKPPC